MPTIKNKNNWLLWRYEPDPARPDKPKKVPYSPNGRRISEHSKVKTWPYEEVVAAYESDPTAFAGIGYSFQGDGTVGVDLDSVLVAGVLTPVAAEIVAKNPTYWEVSPNGGGLHGFFEGSIVKALTPTKLDDYGGKIEIYDRGRFFTWTGNCFSGSLESLTAFPDTLNAYIIASAIEKEPSVSFSERAKKCKADLLLMPMSVQGDNGSTRLLKAARKIIGAGLSGPQGFKLFEWFATEHSDPAWKKATDDKQGYLRKWKTALATAEREGDIGAHAESQFTGQEFGEIDDVAPGAVAEDDLESEPGARAEFPPTEQLLFPGFVEMFARWHAARSRSNNLRYGAAGGIAMLSLLMARRVFNWDGTAPNLYVLVLGSSGTGKTEMIGSLTDFAVHLGISLQIVESFSGAAALEDDLLNYKSIMVVVDEAHNFHAVAHFSKDPNISSTKRFFKIMYSASKRPYQRRSLASSRDKQGNMIPVHVDQIMIDKPHLCSLQCAPPNNFWESMDPASFHDGDAARLMQIEIIVEPEHNPFPADDQELLAELLRRAQAFEEIEPPTVSRLVKIKQTSTNLLLVEEKYLDLIEPRRLGIHPDAQTLGSKYQSKWQKLGNECALRGDETKASFWRRAFECVCKLDFIIACSAFDPSEGNIEDYMVEVEHTQRALDLVIPMLNQKYAAIVNAGGDDVYWRDVERTEHLALSDEHGGILSWSEFSRRIKQKPDVLKKIAESLQETGKLILVSDYEYTNKRGERRTKKVFLSPEQFKKYRAEHPKKSGGSQ